MNRQSNTLLFEGVCLELPSSSPLAHVDVRFRAAVCGPDPGDPGDPADPGKGSVFLSFLRTAVTFDTGGRSRVMCFFFLTGSP